jgi:hypothetical protein
MRVKITKSVENAVDCGEFFTRPSKVSLLNRTTPKPFEKINFAPSALLKGIIWQGLGQITRR